MRKCELISSSEIAQKYFLCCTDGTLPAFKFASCKVPFSSFLPYFRLECFSLLTAPFDPHTQTERQCEAPQLHRASKPLKDSYVVEQVFSPHPFPPSVKSHMKSSPLYTDLRLTDLSEGKRAQPSWTIEEYKRNAMDKSKLATLDLQVSDA